MVHRFMLPLFVLLAALSAVPHAQDGKVVTIIGATLINPAGAPVPNAVIAINDPPFPGLFQWVRLRLEPHPQEADPPARSSTHAAGS